MFMRHLWPALQWMYGNILRLWSYVTRPFRRRSYSTELPLASPVVPSTPSFIQSQEPIFTPDAMRIFQLNDGPAQESHLARNKVAVQKMRNPPPNINRIASMSSTDPSPGFSLLTDVVENLVTSDSPSLYSSPPSSPSSSLDTPCIVVSSPMSEIVNLPHSDARKSLDHELRQPLPMKSIPQGEFPWPRYVPPEVSSFAKRRNFRGAPIRLTNVSRDFLPSPASRLSQGYVTPTDLQRQQSLSRPKSALAVVTDFVRASTNMPPRNISRETLVVSPESQAAFTQGSPFSAQAESFFIDDHLTRTREFDIHDLGIYTDAGATLNLQTPKRKRTAIPSRPLVASFCATTNKYEMPILAKGLDQECCRSSSFSVMADTSQKLPRTLSGNSQTNITSATSSGSVVPSSALFKVLDAQEPYSPGLSAHESEANGDDHLVARVDEESLVAPSKESPYSSLIFPFSLEDSVSWDTTSGSQYRGVDSANLHCSFVPCPDVTLGSVKSGDNVVDRAVFECDSLLSTPALSISDHQCGNPPSPVYILTPETDPIEDRSVMPDAFKCSIVLPTTPPSVLDESFVAGPTAAALDTDALLWTKNTVVLCGEQSDTASNIREAPVRQVGLLDGLFVSTGDSSALPPISESTFCVGGSQTFSSLMSVPSVDRDLSASVANNRRARRAGIYGLHFPPLVFPNSEDNALSEHGKWLDRSASDRPRSTSRQLSRTGSALRPLVLPIRVAIRELSSASAGDRSLDKSPDILLQSDRNSIGFPPPYPLPELPHKPSLASEELEALQKPANIPTTSLAFSESCPTEPELEECYPDPDGEDSAHTINWGVAF